MSKLNLLVSHTDMNSFCSAWIKPALEDFNIIYFQDGKQYSKKDTIIVTGCINQSKWFQDLYLDGFKIVIDNLWEPIQSTNLVGHQCANRNWFWYNESLWYRHRNLHTYVPNKKYEKDAFVPMNLKKSFRDKLYKIILSYENKFLYSYRDMGRYLPNDSQDKEWQRHFNADWYNDTCYSIVAETLVDADKPLFITEKTFKPLAFRHPFMIVGQIKLLRWLHFLGFVTYDNLFDESYDQIADIDKKLSVIQKNIENFSKRPYDNLTLEKIEHNHNLFYDQQQVLYRIKQEIVYPIRNYAET